MRPHRPARRSACALAISLAILAACSTADPATAPADTGAARSQSSMTSDYGTLIDVRTPEEFAAGHLEGAINIDVSAADFTDRIADLDPETRYTLYCRSGRRAADAVTTMSAAGFLHLRNAGGLEDASHALGLPIVTE